MHTKDIEHWLDTRPFEPFVMHLTTGERVLLRHPENCYIGKNSVFVVYAKERKIEGFSNVSLFHVAKIERLDGQPEQHRENGQR